MATLIVCLWVIWLGRRWFIVSGDDFRIEARLIECVCVFMLDAWRGVMCVVTSLDPLADGGSA